MTDPRQDMAAATPRITFYVIALVLGIGGATLAGASGLHGTLQVAAVLALALPAGLWITGLVTAPSRELLERRATSGDARPDAPRV